MSLVILLNPFRWTSLQTDNPLETPDLKPNHRVKEEIGRTTMYFRGILDEEKHNKMLERNLIKFKNYAIFSGIT